MKTKYPILLVHGLAMKDTFFMRSFGKIDRILRIQGYTVYTSDIDAFGSVEGNAGQLKKEILGILKAENAEKVNLIAHSKGGLDARHMLENLDMHQHVASLTTLCTPHRGSPIATFILKFPKPLIKCAAFWVNLAYKILGDKNPDSLTACMQLRRAGDIGYETLASVPGVFCQSFSATIRKGDKNTDFIMSIPAFFSRLLEKNAETDGLVPKDSAIYGQYRGDCTDGSVSHTEIVDFMLRDKQKDKVYAFYSRLCEELYEMGM